jgi:hypothetical protein
METAAPPTDHIGSLEAFLPSAYRTAPWGFHGFSMGPGWAKSTSEIHLVDA